MSLVHLTESNRVDLGEGKETLGDRNDILHLPDRVDSVFDSLSVFCTSTIENTLDFGNLGLSPITVGLANGLECKPRVKGDSRDQIALRTLAMKVSSRKKPTAITVSSFIT